MQIGDGFDIFIKLAVDLEFGKIDDIEKIEHTHSLPKGLLRDHHQGENLLTGDAVAFGQLHIKADVIGR